MRPGLLAALTCAVLVACTTSAPISTNTEAPTQTAGAQPTTSLTARPSSGPSASPTVVTTPSSPTAELPAWRVRTDIAPGPSAREDHTWTFDPDSGIAYLFGGRSGNGPQSDLWAFDLGTNEWTEQHPVGPGPSARFGHTATWVPGTGLVVWSGQGDTFFGDIWAYEPIADAWRELPSLGAVPEPRYGSCATLGPDGRLWISHGFTQDDGRFADTRAYDFLTGAWTDMTPTGDLPVKRCLHDCFWAPSDQLILYGGQTTGTPALGDLWSYDLASQRWHEASPQSAPPRQLYALLARDPANSGVIVFGGGDSSGGYLGDTWALDWGALQMHQLDFGDGPSARSGATLIADPSDRLLLFGGQNATGLLGDLWELSPGP